MNRFGSDVVAWVGILGGGAVAVAATAAFVSLRAEGPAAVAALTGSGCTLTAESTRELRVSTVEPKSGIGGHTIQYVFHTPCPTSDEDEIDRRIRIHVSPKPNTTHIRHAPLVTTIEKVEIEAVREQLENERFEAARELREEIEAAERRLEEAEERVAEARVEAKVGEETREQMELVRAELAERLRRLARELAEARKAGGAP